MWFVGNPLKTHFISDYFLILNWIVDLETCKYLRIFSPVGSCRVKEAINLLITFPLFGSTCQ